MASQKELTSDVKTLVSALHIPYTEFSVGNGIPTGFRVDLFGTIVMGIDRKDYSHALSKLHLEYKGYRLFFITSSDNFVEKKDELIFDLMRSGYIRFIRLKYPNLFTNLLNDHNYARKIINERLKVWGDTPKFQFLAEENKEAINQAVSYIEAVDPSFFDYMPETQGE